MPGLSQQAYWEGVGRWRHTQGAPRSHRGSHPTTALSTFPTHSSEQTPHCRPLKPSSDTRESVLPPKTHLMFVLIQNQVGPMKPTPQLCLS